MARISTVLFILLLSTNWALAQLNDMPDWVPDAVFYQIFPERFYNGDSSNDPRLTDQIGSWPHDQSSPWRLSPWTSDWYKLQPWEKANGHDFWYNVQRRRYGGDLQGVVNKLDYLQRLGITAIYFNPLFESPSLHKYDASTYIHIDDNFGPNPAKDRQIVQKEIPDDPSTWRWTTADSLFLKLIKEAHRRGIRVIIDGVFNHVGQTHWAFLDVKKNGPQSRFKDWFIIKSWDNPATVQNEFDYAGWMGVKELPEWREDENGLVEPVKKHIFHILQRWMDPNNDGNPSDGVDGWRLDVAEMIHHNFWKRFRKEVKRINPQAYITAEIFWDDWKTNKLMDPAPWLKGDEFDGVMNYRWAALAVNYFIDHKNKISAGEFARRLQALDKSYLPATRYFLQNLMDSHDTDRLASNIVNPDLFYDKHVGVPDNPNYNVRKPNAREWRILRLIALFQFASPGPPMIYYGTEAGMWGGDDPDDRKPMVWPELKYEDEVANMSRKPRPRDIVAFDQELFDYYRRLIELRKKHPALRSGKLKWYLTDDQNDLLGFWRQGKEEKVLILLNNSSKLQKINIKVESHSAAQDILSAKRFLVKDGYINLSLPAKTGVFLKVD